MTDAAVVKDPPADTAGADPAVEVMSRAEAQKIIAERDRYKAQAKENTTAAARLKELEDAGKTEAEKLAARIRELEPVNERATKLDGVVSRLYEQELATVPEALRDLVPQQLSIEDRLDWLRDAKAKGLFAQPPESPLPNPASPLQRRPTSGGGNTITKSALATLPIGLQRTATMQAIREGKITVIDG